MQEMDVTDANDAREHCRISQRSIQAMKSMDAKEPEAAKTLRST